ncbi:hypothetical protein [Vibrio owensii]|uniref:hypothetical protein n=1 Tax=Vibrio harveyi group TaxID=717610 RepID=UPI003CC5E318
MNQFFYDNEIIIESYNCVIDSIENDNINMRVYDLEDVQVMDITVKLDDLINHCVIITNETGKVPRFRRVTSEELKENLVLKWEIGQDTEQHKTDDEGFVRFVINERILNPEEQAEFERKVKRQIQVMSNVFDSPKTVQ